MGAKLKTLSNKKYFKQTNYTVPIDSYKYLYFLDRSHICLWCCVASVVKTLPIYL